MKPRAKGHVNYKRCRRLEGVMDDEAGIIQSGKRR